MTTLNDIIIGDTLGVAKRLGIGSANTVLKFDGTNIVWGNYVGSPTYVGTTSIALNRASAAQALTGITSIDGTASNVSGTPALPNGTTATTQATGDNTTKLSTTAFTQATISATANEQAGSGNSLTVRYRCVCTTNTLTITALVAADTINTADISVVNYIAVN